MDNVAGNVVESISRKMLREVLETEGGLAAILKADMSDPGTKLVFLPQRVTKDNVTNFFHQVTAGLPCQGARVNTIVRLGVKVAPDVWIWRALQACDTCPDEEGKALLQTKVQAYVDRMDVHTPLMYAHWGPQGLNPPSLLHLPSDSYVGVKFSRPQVACPPAADERRLDAQGLPIAAEQNGVAAYVDGFMERATCAFEMTFTFKFNISSQSLPGVFLRFALIDREANFAFKALDTPPFRIVKGNLPYGAAKVPCDIAAWVKRDIATNGPPPELCMDTVRADLQIHAFDPDPLNTADLDPAPFADEPHLDVDAAEEVVTGMTEEQIFEAVSMETPEELLAAAEEAGRLIPAPPAPPKRQRLAAQSAAPSSAENSPVQRSLAASAAASASPATTYRSCAMSSPSSALCQDDEPMTYRGCSAGCSDDVCSDDARPRPAFRALGGVAVRGASRPTPNAAEDHGRALRRSLHALMARVRGSGRVSAADCWELVELRKRCAGLVQG